MELLLMLDAARGASAAQITAVIPHYAYARSDKKDASRISLGGRLVADMLVSRRRDRVLTMTLHAPQVHGFFSVPVDHLTALGVLADHFRGQRPRATRSSSRPTSATPRRRPSSRGCSGLPGRRRQQAAAGRRPGRHRRHRRRRRRQAGDRPRRRDRHRRLDRRAARRLPSSAAPRPPSPARTGCSSARPSSGSRDHPMITEVVTTDTVPRAGRLARAEVRSVAGAVRRGDPRIHAGESVSSLFDGVDPAHGPPQPAALRRAPRRVRVVRWSSPSRGSLTVGGGECECVLPRRLRRSAPLTSYAHGGGGRTHRDLRLRLRRPDGRPGRARPAAARAGALPRRHRAPAVRAEADRRGPRVRARVPGPPRRPAASRCSSSPATARAPRCCATPGSATPCRSSR